MLTGPSLFEILDVSAFADAPRLAYASISDATLIIAGLAIGAAAAFLGWTLPKRGARTQAAVVAQ